MYFAKQVGCWRVIRQRLGITDPHSLVSIGAGPLLCVSGWFWDDPTRGAECALRAYDLLDWNGVMTMPELKTLGVELYLGTSQYFAGRYIPPGVRPPQSSVVMSAPAPISVAEIGGGNVVLLPSILNHLVGGHDPLQQSDQHLLFAWLEDVRRAKNTVVIADMFYRGDTAAFWGRITSGLGAPTGSEAINLKYVAEANDVAQAAYSDSYQQRRRGGFNSVLTTPADHQKAGVLVGTANGWQWLP